MALALIADSPLPEEELDATPSPLDRSLKLPRLAYLGAGPVRPFRRDLKNDFANATDLPLVKACVGQVLGTRAAGGPAQGELRWFTEFGSRLYLLKHQNNDIILGELARVYVMDALKRWEPRVVLKRVSVRRERANPDDGLNVLVISLRYDVVSTDVAGNEVLVADVTQDVVV